MARALRPFELPALLLLVLAVVPAITGCSPTPDDRCPDGTAAPCPAATTGSLAITVSGLLTGAAADMTVTGPSFSRRVTATETLTVQPGTYTITASPVLGGPLHYEPRTASQAVSVVVGRTTGATVDYRLAAPRLHLSAAGLPVGVRPPWSFGAAASGTFGVAMPADTIVTDLAPGLYSIRAGGIQDGTGILVPEPGVVTFFLAPGIVGDVAIAWHGASLRDLTPSTNGAGGAPATGLSSPAGGTAIIFRVVVPQGATRLRITTSGGNGDVDLYCRAGAPPGFPDQVTAFGEGPDVNEQCTVENPQAGFWYAQIQEGGAPFGGVTVSAFVTTP